MGNCLKKNKINFKINANCEINIKKIKLEKNGILDIRNEMDMNVWDQLVYSENCNFMIDTENQNIFKVKNILENNHNKNLYNFCLKKNKKNWFVKVNNFGNPEKVNKFWIYLDNLNKEELKKNQYIKMGKLNLCYLGNKKDCKIIDEIQDSLSSYKSKKKKNKAYCRICLDSESSDNIFVNICKCSKKMPIHYTCIKKWLEKFIFVTETKFCIYYKYKNFKCEICSDFFPSHFEYNNKIYPLFDIPKDDFIILNVYNYDLKEIKETILILLNKNNFEYNIGRLSKNEVLIQDTSVSRNHSKLFFSSNKLFITDNDSRFGTLKEFNIDDKEIKIKKDFKTKITFNNFLFEISLSKNTFNYSEKSKLLNEYSINPKLYEIDKPPTEEKNIKKSVEKSVDSIESLNERSKQFNIYSNYLEKINIEDKSKNNSLNKSISLKNINKNIDESLIISNFEKMLREGKSQDPLNITKNNNRNSSSILNNEIFETYNNHSYKKIENNFKTNLEIKEVLEEIDNSNYKSKGKNSNWNKLKNIVQIKGYKCLLKKPNKYWKIVKFLFSQKKLNNNKKIIKVKSWDDIKENIKKLKRIKSF